MPHEDTQRLIALSLLAALSGCGGGASTEPTPEPATTGSETAVTLSPLEELNARARAAGATTETLHGVEVEDPYRALETESELTSEWIRWQSERTTQALAGWTHEATGARLRELLSIGTVGGAQTAGDWVLYTRREGDREQPALFVRPVRGGAERMLVDPLTYGERAALDWYFVSPRGRYLAFGISENGDERSTLRIAELSTGNVLSDSIPNTKWSAVAWLHSEDAFYYRRYPRAGEPDFDPEHPDTYHQRIFFHTIGTDQAADPLVYSAPQATDFPHPSISDDDRYLTINVFRGWSESDVLLFDRGRAARGRLVGPDEAHPLTPVVVGEPHLYTGIVHRNRLFIGTNDGAPRTRIMAVDPARAGDRAAWAEVVPQGESAVEDWIVAGDRLVLHVIEGMRSRLRVHRLDGRADGEIALPGSGTVQGLSDDFVSGRIVFGYSDFVSVPRVLSWSPRGRRVETLAEVQSPVDLSQFEVSEDDVPSRDGTPIHVFWLHRRDMPRDGERPVVLTGYGGFNIAMLPVFTRHPLYWVERGGIYAMANLRGGSERGEEWHQAGALGNKEHVFEDMEAVIRWFGSNGVSRPGRIAITGASNGGLLMGAMITRCPDAFAAAATYVGLYDMIRYHQFPPAELWVTEYGSSADETQFGWLRAYSPYHLVRSGVQYPPILVETADHDTRVHWGHSTKFAARLQEALGGADPSVWFYRETGVGHGAGLRLSDLVSRYQRFYGFVEHHLGVEPPAEAASAPVAAEAE